MINLEIVEDVYDIIYDILHEDTMVTLYVNETNGIIILADEYFVVKLFKDIHKGFHRCQQEVKNHCYIYEKNPSCVLKIYKHFQDTEYSCILYERGYDICQDEIEENIEKFYELIQKCNITGIYNIDTKSSNFLKNYDGEYFLHDFGLCYYDEQINKSPNYDLIKLKIAEVQTRLLLTGWTSSNVPYEFLNKYNIHNYFNLPIDTMYQDYFLELQKIIKLYS